MLAEKLGKLLVGLTITFITSGLLFAAIPFATPANLTKNPTPSVSPAIAVDQQSNINIVWTDQIGTSGINNVFFMRSTNGGGTFSSPLNLSVSTSGNGSTWPHIAVDNATPINAIYVVWDGSYPTQDIYFRKSVDGGINWIPQLPFLATNISQSLLGDGLGGAKEPRVTAEGNGTVYAVWDHQVTGGHCQVHYRKSLDRGNNWDPPIGSPARNLSNDPSPWLAERADIIVLQGVVYVVWDDNRMGGNWEIFFRGSPDGGTTWQPALTSAGLDISNNPGISQFPKVAVDQFSINVAWDDTSQGAQDQIFYNRSISGGFTEQSPVNVSNDLPNSARIPSIASDFLTGYIFVVWADNNNTPSFQIYFSDSNQGGAFSSRQNISGTPGSAFRPAIAVDQYGIAYVVWYDNSPGNNDIYFTYSLIGLRPRR